MPAEAIAELVTAEELEHLDIPGKVTALDRGWLVVREPPGTWHSSTAARLTYFLGEFGSINELGLICAQDTGFKIGTDPDS